MWFIIWTEKFAKEEPLEADQRHGNGTGRCAGADPVGADPTGADFAGTEFAGMDLAGTGLAGTDLAGAKRPYCRSG